MGGGVASAQVRGRTCMQQSADPVIVCRRFGNCGVSHVLHARTTHGSPKTVLNLVFRKQVLPAQTCRDAQEQPFGRVEPQPTLMCEPDSTLRTPAFARARLSKLIDAHSDAMLMHMHMLPNIADAILEQKVTPRGDLVTSPHSSALF